MANSRKKCRQCQTFRPIAEMKIVQLGAFCIDTQCQIKYGLESTDKALEKARKNIKKEQRVEAKAEKDKKKANSKDARDLKRKDLDWQHGLTQPVFNRMRVLEEMLWFQDRGLEPECISCGKNNMDWCCGHHKSRGAKTELRYDRKNTMLQCNWRCNKNLSANIDGDMGTRGYLNGLRERFGQEEGQAIIDYVNRHHPSKNWAWQDLEEYRAKCSARIRELEKQVA